MGQKKKIAVIFSAVFIFSLSINYSFALHQEFQEIKKLDEAEKQELPEVVVVPKVEYKAEGLKNPFQGFVKKAGEEASALRPGEDASAAPPPLTIQGIVWGGNFPQAIIDNKVVKVGDTVQDAQIVEISRNKVIILFKDRKFNLSSPAVLNLQNLEQQFKGGKDEK